MANKLEGSINAYIELFPVNLIARKANSLFKDQLKNRVGQDEPTKFKILQQYYLTFSGLSELSLNSLFISLTTSNTIFFRFSADGYEFKLSVFIDSYDENDNIEGALHIYKNEEKESSDFGTVAYLLGIVYDKILMKPAYAIDKIHGFVGKYNNPPEEILKQNLTRKTAS